MARQSIVSIKRDGNLLHVDVVGYPRETIDAEALADGVRDEALFNGLSQTIVDSAALPKDERGRPASPAAKHAAIMARLTTIRAGFWTSGGAIYQAIAAVTGKPYAEARAWFDAKTPDERKAIRDTTRVQDALAALRPTAASGIGDD